ncbi:MAG: hypothetical protein ACLGG0_05620 [Bacteriovoracia bacterium]
MNKYIILLALLLGCASKPKLKSVAISEYPLCSKATDTLEKLPVFPELYKDDLLKKDLKAKALHSNPIDIDNFTEIYSSLCNREKIYFLGKESRIDRADKIIIYKNRLGRPSREQMDELYEHDQYTTYTPEALAKEFSNAIDSISPKNKLESLKSLKEPLHFKKSYQYSNHSGLMKNEAVASRALELDQFIVDALYRAAELVREKIFLDYLEDHTPLPVDKRETSFKFSTLSIKREELREQFSSPHSEYILSAPKGDLALDTYQHFSLLANRDKSTYYDCHLGRSCNEVLKPLLFNKEKRTELTSLLLIGVTSLDINRSEDKKTINISVNVNIPALFSEFKFDQISKHIEP